MLWHSGVIFQGIHLETLRNQERFLRFQVTVVRSWYIWHVACSCGLLNMASGIK